MLNLKSSKGNKRSNREKKRKNVSFTKSDKDVRTHSIRPDQGMLKEQRKVFHHPKENFAQNKIRLGNQRMLYRNIYDNWNQVPNHFFIKFCCVVFEQLFKLVSTSPLGKKRTKCVFMWFGNLPRDSLWIWTDAGHSLCIANSENKIRFELKFVRRERRKVLYQTHD